MPARFPVHVGDLVHTYAQVNWTGRTSMEVGVRVEAEPWNVPDRTPLQVATAFLAFVAIMLIVLEAYCVYELNHIHPPDRSSQSGVPGFANRGTGSHGLKSRSS